MTHDTSGQHLNFCSVCGGLMALDSAQLLGMHPSCVGKAAHGSRIRSTPNREDAARILGLCLHACKIALAKERDCGTEKDHLGEEYFHVKMLKDAIAQAAQAGYQ